MHTERNLPPTSKFGATGGASIFKFEDESLKQGSNNQNWETSEMEEEKYVSPSKVNIVSESYMDRAVVRK